MDLYLVSLEKSALRWLDRTPYGAAMSLFARCHVSSERFDPLYLAQRLVNAGRWPRFLSQDISANKRTMDQLF